MSSTETNHVAAHSTGSVAVKAAHQPDWADPELLAEVLAQLGERPPLVSAESVRALSGELEFVARGEAFVIQAGECAELFADSGHARIQHKSAQLHQLADRMEEVGLPTVRLGRFAGQYAKPRSSRTETSPDGTVVPSYFGDAVNEVSPTTAARRLDPARLLSAYDHAAGALDALFMRQLLLSEGASGVSSMLAPTYISHEALLLDFEHSLIRTDHVKGSSYASSAHQLWIGERTRQLDHAHIKFAEAINNPVGVKLGPTAEPREVAELGERLAAGRTIGRLSLVVRMGARQLAGRLPAIIDALGPRAREVVWLCDPMHGNTVHAEDGTKTRVLSHVLAEVDQFYEVLRAQGCWPGGLHLEATPDDVTECVDSPDELTSTPACRRFESACDPRLNPTQAEQVVRRATVNTVFRPKQD
ncbi:MULTISPECIES: 3-deoxy-7-phosphoheptulonate synthase [unclassified Actinopolyspora]|uniref:3-deoxy-7-phosphoheptulonate synthase n=1 Tax=unclassified Actinopolyspora TaxID=2639451 RepID=UPI0013F61D39|nr:MULTISPECIES: 3-deoxy-7-phosphoheptulonate synthase [unclassified Actinopolyspora]NHD19430.1 3-deoxy-7-phosphoheptulonate synthase [Actinopolyspora sp. BKK2]NHE78497.1 3-deoxy-7-phosphoheptulonate synthase [Actinopolyspora sp. BKK1]